MDAAYAHCLYGCPAQQHNHYSCMWSLGLPRSTQYSDTPQHSSPTRGLQPSLEMEHRSIQYSVLTPLPSCKSAALPGQRGGAQRHSTALIPTRGLQHSLGLESSESLLATRVMTLPAMSIALTLSGSVEHSFFCVCVLRCVYCGGPCHTTYHVLRKYSFL